jgi:dihydroorotate dehydrogenase electron transfer subunit
MAKKVMQTRLRIAANKKISKNYFKLSLLSPAVSALAQPGQFVAIKVSESDIPLLRRPFGIHKVNGKTFDCLVEIVGPATEILSRKKAGEYLDVIGPLGNGFEYRPKTTGQRPKILIAGGMGVAPLTFLAEKLTEFKNQNSKIKIIALMGAKTKKQVLCEKEFKNLGCDVRIATDDGSKGFKGKVTDLLKDLLTTYDLRLTTIYACGPKPMLKEISRISKNYNIPAQISLEEHTSCGIGACLGCVIKVKGQNLKVKGGFEYKRVCKEGPVFDAKDIIW